MTTTNVFQLGNSALLYFSYKHAGDGIYQVVKHEGVLKLWSGASMASGRAIFVTIGQVRRY